MSLRMGVAKVDITPDHPVPLAGFASRNNEVYERIASRIFMRIAYFTSALSPDFASQEESLSTSAAIVISADLLWWGSELTDEIQREIHSRWGIPAANVILHGTHSHSGPQTSSHVHPLLGGKDSAYLQKLKALVMEGIEQARQNVQPVKIQKHTGSCDIGIQRRTVVDGRAIMKPNPNGPIDRQVQVFKFVGEVDEQKPLAIFVHFAAHPVISRENQLSSEYPGMAMELLEAEHCLTAFFFQGCCGDININLLKSGGFANGNQSAILAIAEQLMDSVNRSMTAPFQQLDTSARLEAWSTSLPMQFKKLQTWHALAKMLDAPSPHREWSDHMLKLGPADPPELQMSLLKLANGLSFLSMNAEVVTEYGLFIKKSTGENVLPLPYTNGMTGYLPTAEQIREGGYEADSSIYYFYLPGELSESNELVVKKAIEDLISRSMREKEADC